mmetsp:Transcript_6167/g.13326  ORF Transcript_6167/g.13326 Transcript_6167/m.13326 type:complete len:81 (-) Transcript_6167:83-325(-)
MQKNPKGQERMKKMNFLILSSLAKKIISLLWGQYRHVGGCGHVHRCRRWPEQHGNVTEFLHFHPVCIKLQVNDYVQEIRM